MVKYKILIDFLCLLAIATACLGCYYTVTSGVSVVLNILVFTVAIIEVFVDLCIIIKVTNTKEEN